MEVKTKYGSVSRNLADIVVWAYGEHDLICNQKYATDLRYSMHLRYVEAQAKRFKHLVINDDNDFSELALWETIVAACACHDLIEDARKSYNDIREVAGENVAEIVFLLTENKGRTRADRHNANYYLEMKANELAVFVKLCDITANILYSALSGSSMLKKYREEYSIVKSYLYCEEYKEMFENLESLLGIKK